MVYLKNKQEIEGIKAAAEIWKKIRTALIKQTRPGMTTKQLEKIALAILQENNAQASFYHYQGFPGYICISINEQIIHGIASNYVLKKEDLITFDIGVTYQNYICDAAFSLVLDKNNFLGQKILTATKACLSQALTVAKPDYYLGDISYQIFKTAQDYGYYVLKNFGGHGCGLKLHEDPIILNYGKQHTGLKLKQGMVLCIEPMLMTDSDEYEIDPKNNWTVLAKNKKLTCHEEQLVLITEKGNEVLTA